MKKGTMKFVSLLCCAAMVLTACSSGSSTTAATEAAAEEEAEAVEEEAEEVLEEAEAVEAEAEEELEEAEAVEAEAEEEAKEVAATGDYTLEEAFDEVGITVEDLAVAGGAWVRGVDSEESQLKFLKAAALLGYGDAAFSLGESYHSGNAYDADQYDDLVTEAVNWWEMAAANGSPRGWDDIGLLYLHQSVPGGGDDYGDIPYDEDIAFDYFQRATDAGDAKAPRHLAQCYENGWGCEVDDEKAFESYVIASDRDDSTATVEVANRYLEGRGVDQDVETAMSMYQKIVDEVGHDVVVCAYKLGEIYENGEYVDADPAKAAEYYQISLDNADEGSPDYTNAEEALARVSG